MWGRGPEISWQADQGNIKAKNRRLSGWSLALYILYTAALSMLLVYAAAVLAADHLDIHLEEEQGRTVWVLGLEIALILIWNEVMHSLGKRKLRWAGNLVLLGVVAWGCFGYYHELSGELAEGLRSMGQRYLDIWNRYYLTTYQLEAGSISKEPLAWGLVLIVAAALVQTFSALLRKRTIMLLLPVTVLAAEMTVGLTPGWRGLACLSVVGLLSLYLDFHREFQVLPVVVLTILLGVGLPLIALVLKEPASKITLLHGQLQSFQHQVEKNIRDYDWQALWRRGEKIDNHSPEYEQKEMLTVRVSSMPGQALYLRGCCGTEYQKGVWDTSEKEFGRVSLWHGLSGGRAAELLAELNCSAYASLLGEKLHYEIQYTGLHGNAAYLPYGADLGTAQESYKLSGDFVVEKAGSLENFSFDGWNPGLLARDGSDIPDSDAERFCSWYNEYAQTQYTEVPKNMPELTDMVNTIKTYAEYKSALAQLTEEDIASRNTARLRLGSLVASQLRARAGYSLDPGSLPQGTDPIEYFLGENQKGYCVHFASAGVLILRQLGVPARYVSGFVVHTSQFTQRGSSYVASVMDENAHAWAEIWLDNVGWVPVEMTPGYEDAEIELLVQDGQSVSLPWKEDALSGVMYEPEPTDAGGQEPEETEDLVTPSPPPQDPSKESGGEEEPENTKNPATNSMGIAGGDTPKEPGVGAGWDQQDGAEGWGFAGEGGWAVFGQNGSLRVSHVVLALLGIGAGVWLCCRVVPTMLRRRVSWQDKIKADIENGNARNVVKLINRRLYRRLWRKRMGMLVLRSDEEYLATLKQQYPQIAEEEWEWYLDVVRRAVYSIEDVLAQEAGRCLSLLMQIKSK